MHYRELTNYDFEQAYIKNVENVSFGKGIRLLYCILSMLFLAGFSCIKNGNEGLVYLMFSFFPSWVYLYLFKKKIKGRAKFTHIIEMILYGAMLSIFFAGILEYFLSLFFLSFCNVCFVKEVKESHLFLCSIVVFFYFFFVVAYVEEISKIIPMVFIQIKAKRNQNMYTELPVIDSVPYINETVHEEADKIRAKNVAKYKYITVNDKLEYIFFSLCSSAGFSSTENLIYAMQTTKQNFFPVIILRNLVCVLFHMCCSGISSYNIVYSTKSEHRKGVAQNLLCIIGSLFSSSLFHAVYDYSIYYSSLNVPLYQVSFLTALFTYCFLSVLLMFFMLIRGIA
ncbi:conserved Plasmodium protein, unknown function [Plasmodium ovale]|uniref:Protease n=1 Tax=Plasmodium ovale TaxID=36330 RepID=A0A1C3KU03_PLAOA|nr:conserved Plasmodium protein, unknown function [Plasmodium ovale]